LGKSGLIITALLLIIFLFAGTIQAVPDSLWNSAGKHYENKSYDLALADYEQLVSDGFASAELNYNIGNCYFKLGELGYAILYYMRAERLSPNDGDIQANLLFAQQFLPTRLEGTKINPLSTFFDSITTSFRLDTMAWIFSLLFIVFIVLISLSLFMTERPLFLRLLTYLLLILVVISLSVTGYKYRTEYITQTGVLVANEAQVYSAPSEESDLEFTAGFGLTFKIKKSSGDYYLVMFENNRLGWVKKELVELI